MMADTHEIDNDLSAFEAMRTDLQAHNNLKWVVFHAGKLIGTYDNFDAAASDAVAKFGRGPYLIRQVGAPEFTIPASVAYRIG